MVLNFRHYFQKHFKLIYIFLKYIHIYIIYYFGIKLDRILSLRKLKKEVVNSTKVSCEKRALRVKLISYYINILMN